MFYYFILYIILYYLKLSHLILYSVYMYKNDSVPMTQRKSPPEYKLMEPKPTQASCFDMHNPTQLFT